MEATEGKGAAFSSLDLERSGLIGVFRLAKALFPFDHRHAADGALATLARQVLAVDQPQDPTVRRITASTACR